MKRKVDKSKGFACDRQAKADATASTLNYLNKRFGINPKNVKYYEYDDDGNPVPFGDARACEQSRSDILMVINFWGYELRFPIELKERSFDHMCHFTTAVTEGAILEVNKKEEAERIMNEEGMPYLWMELYIDKKIRLWNFAYLNLNSLPLVPKTKGKYTVFNSPKITEDVYLLPAGKSLIIDRIEGSYDK